MTKKGTIVISATAIIGGLVLREHNPTPKKKAAGNIIIFLGIMGILFSTTNAFSK